MAPKTAPVALQAARISSPAPWNSARQDGGQGGAEDVADHAVDHADRGQAAALVVIAGQLGSERVVGHGDHGVEGIHQPEGEQDRQEGGYACQPCRQREHQPGCQPEGHHTQQHEDAPAAKARAGAVRDIAEERIVDRIPGELAGHQRRARQGGIDPGNIGVVIQEEELHGGGDQGNAKIGQTVAEFEAER